MYIYCIYRIIREMKAGRDKRKRGQMEAGRDRRKRGQMEAGRDKRKRGQMKAGRYRVRLRHMYYVG